MYVGLGSYFNSLLYQDSEARTQAREARFRVEDVAGRVDRLSLLMMAVWSLARDQLGLSEEQLLQRIQELDLSDGKLDGRVAQGVSECAKCKRMLSPRHLRCIYCGQVRTAATAP